MGRFEVLILLPAPALEPRRCLRRAGISSGATPGLDRTSAAINLKWFYHFRYNFLTDFFT